MAVAAGFLFALTSLGRAVSGAVPLAPVFFRLSDENYYFWQMMLVLPGVLLGWLMAAKLVSLFGKKQNRPALLQKGAVLSGPAMALPLLLVWIPQAVQTVLMLLGMGQEEFVEILSQPGLWQGLYIGIHIAGLIWSAFLFALAARYSQSIGKGKAGIAGLVVTAALAGVYVLLIR